MWRKIHFFWACTLTSIHCSVPEDESAEVTEPGDANTDNIAIVLSVDDSVDDDNEDVGPDESTPNDEKIIADIIIITDDAHTPIPNDLGIIPVVIDDSTSDGDDVKTIMQRIDETPQATLEQNSIDSHSEVNKQHDNNDQESSHLNDNNPKDKEAGVYNGDDDEDLPEGSVSVPRDIPSPRSRQSQESIKSLTFDIFHEIDKCIGSPASVLTSISYHMVVLQHHALNGLQSMLGERIEELSANNDLGFNGLLNMAVIIEICAAWLDYGYLRMD